MPQLGPAALLFHGLSDKMNLRCDLSHVDVDDRSLVGASRSSINRNTSMYSWLAGANYSVDVTNLLWFL
jgi:hypothetical protein